MVKLVKNKREQPVKPGTQQKIRARAVVSLLGEGDARPLLEAVMPVSERIDLATEAVVGARWLLMLACESMKGAVALEAELAKAARNVDRLDELRNLLMERRAESTDPKAIA